MAYCIYYQAQNILSELRKCPDYPRRMEYTMLSLESILIDAEEKQDHNRYLHNWLKELQQVFFQIEGSIDELKREAYEQEGIGKQVLAPFLCANRIVHTCKMEKLLNHLDTVASKMYQFNLAERHTDSIEMETTHSFLSATEVSTRLMKPSWKFLYPLTYPPKDYNENQSKEFLNDFKISTHRWFHIVGKLGTGKTTLAKFFYNDLDVQKKFPTRFWVCVKEEFDTQRLMKEIISTSYYPETCDNLTEKQLCSTVQHLSNKFLLVLQDLSTKNLDNPSMFKSLLWMGSRDSKIIVTTQNEKIADVIGLGKVYKPEKQSQQNLEPIQSQKINNEEESSQANHPGELEAFKTHQTIVKVEKLSDDNSVTLLGDYAFRDTRKPEKQSQQNLEPIQSQKINNEEESIQANHPGELEAFKTHQTIFKVEKLSDDNSVTLLGDYASRDTRKPEKQSQQNLEPIQSEKINNEEESIQANHSGELEAFKTHQTIVKVEKLSDDNSVTLLGDYAFRDTWEEENPKFTKIEMKIVEKCEGVPLAIKCFGSLLASDPSIAEQMAEWTHINWTSNVNKQAREEDKEEGSILPVLRLCYDLMPSHLKLCFLSCSQLPNDRILSSNDVIQLWMAHGHLQLQSSQDDYLSLENRGEKIFKELCSRCFLQKIEEYGLGCWFEMHPLIRKLAHKLAQEKENGSTRIKPVTEIKSIAFRVRDKVLPSAFLADKCISTFQCLRLLYLGHTDVQKIPDAIGTLKYLRYLDLQENKKIKRLPNSICNLQNLQTLIVASCSALEELPHGIRKLINLRYLWVSANQLHLHKNGVGTMTSLRFLAIGGCDNLQDLFKRPSSLQRLGTLMIYDCNALARLPNEMGSLLSLQNLVIWNCKQLTLTLKEVEFSLQRFTIRDLPKVHDLPEWLHRSAETLRVLEIIDCPMKLEKKKFRTYKAIVSLIIQGAVRVKLSTGKYADKRLNFVRRHPKDVNKEGDMLLNFDEQE